MRIAVVVTSFPSISQTFVLGQITGLIDRGHEVDIYAAASEPEVGGAEHAVVKEYGLMKRARYQPARAVGASWVRRFAASVYVLARYWWRDPRNAWRVVKGPQRQFGYSSRLSLLSAGAPFAGRGRYDAVLCHFGPNGRRIARLRRAGLVHGKIATVFHGYDMSRYLITRGTNAYQQLFDDGDLFLPVSEFWRSRLIDLGCPPGKIAVHHMGIDLSKFPVRERRATRDDDEPVRLLSVARLVEKKGIEYAIRAVASSRDVTGRRIEYSILGDGPLRGRLEKLVRELDTGDSVKLVGESNQDGVRAAMRGADIFVAPSVVAEDGDMEGVPVSIMEAMACGLPVVSTLHSGIPELVRDKVSGFLVPERDSYALSHAFTRLVDDPRLRRRMGNAGRTAVERGYDLDDLNDRLVDLLATMNRPHGHPRLARHPAGAGA
ncbi:MAG TPA: glycosyltransferase [Gemmatimonadaceae bacterium]|nr:glycosyltransferase [Gemmatimonadaceae bacterium]